MRLRTIAVLNQKGGVGKTTTVVNMAAALALKGRQVLVIDMDPQAHLTIHLGADRDADAPGTYEVLTEGASLTDAARSVRENLWLLGASIDLVGAEAELVTEVGREIILRQALETVRSRFDYVIIDCPPSLGLLTLNALAAVDEVVIPIQPHFLALQGFSRLLQTITLVQTRINPALRVSAILMCMFDSRTSLSNEVCQDIERFLSAARSSEQPWSRAAVIPVHIRRNIKLAEAPSHGQTIFEYEPTCNGAADYQAVADFIDYPAPAAESAPVADREQPALHIDTTAPIEVSANPANTANALQTEAQPAAEEKPAGV
ncbi:MAG: AAA family ATPase [Planctomycetales bacterium]|nr:AAA family ATPase [Planctomycetales bacterium]